MKYEEALSKAIKAGCEIITEEELIKRLKEEGDVTYFGPYGCLHCGKAWGEKDFEEIRYVIYTDQIMENNPELVDELGYSDGGTFAYADIAKCRFCGHSDIFSEVYDVK